MKKLIALITLLVAAACMLSGCSQESPLDGIPNPEAVIELSDGSSMRFELFVQEAPNTVANFVSLARSGFYDGRSFFRIVPGAFIQSGDPFDDGTGGAGYVIQGEFSQNRIGNNVAHTRGTISMSRQEEEFDSASSQFFIMQGNYPEYNGKYAAFGRAMDEESLAVIDRIASAMVDKKHSPVSPVPTIAHVTVETYGYKYEPAIIEPSDEDEQEADKKEKQK